MIAFAALLVQGAATIGQLWQSGDWIGTCVPGDACVARVLPPDGGAAARPLDLPLTLRRDPATGQVSVAMPLPASLRKGGKARLMVDGKTVAQVVAPGGGGGLALPLDARLGPAFAGGKVVAIGNPRGRVLARASLAGFEAARAYVQGFAAPTLTIVAMPAADASRPPRVLKAKEMRRFQKEHPCAPWAAGMPAATRLDAARTLSFMAASCADGQLLAPAIIDEKGRVTLAAIDPPLPGTRATWDDAARQLVLTPPATPTRCTPEQRHVWDGSRLALVERRYTCRGVAEPVVTWRAQVAAR